MKRDGRSTGRGRALLALAVAVFAVGSWLAAHRGVPWLLFSGDEYEYADIGRRLAQGRGFTTGVIFPPHLSYGVDTEHPNLVRAPLWPLVLAGAFTLTAPDPRIVHVAALLFFAGTAVAAALLAAELAGALAGALTGVAVATSPQLSALAIGGLSETCFAFWTALAFLLCVRRAHPFWIGAVCALGYLTRYNGVSLLPVLLVYLWFTPRRLASLLWCAGGFVLFALPWWIRNALVAGNPFYALTQYNLFMSPLVMRPYGSLLYQLEPDLGSAAAMAPLEKLRLALPRLLRYWPPASANAVACAGVFLACVRRERTSLAFGLLAVGTTFGVALSGVLGRYFVPLVPLLLALGVVGLTRYGGRLRAPALALLLATPLLPPLVAEMPDLAFARSSLREMQSDSDVVDAASEQKRLAARCLSRDTLVIGHWVSRLVWWTDTLGIHQPARAEDFWRVVDEHPVDFARVPDPGTLVPERFEERFVRRRDCGEHVYQRRARPGS